MRILFVSTLVNSRWGGSEELWSRAALRLLEQGAYVAASVYDHSPSPPQVLELRKRGVDIDARPNSFPAWQRIYHRMSRQPRSLYVEHLQRFVERLNPSLIVFSDGGPRPPIEFIELGVKMGVPFAVISQANFDSAWVGDDEVERYQAALSAAQRYYFVSDANWRLAERQTGCTFPNAEVVRNPFNVPYDAAPPWPSMDEKSKLHMACVARLHAPSKGQDMLLQVLAEPQWSARNWTLSLYGEGPNKIALKNLAEKLGLGRRATFCGHVADVVGIWERNHVLIMPSRSEGLPLAMVEAMMCGRPAVATDVAGNSEIVIHGQTGFLAEAAAIPSIRAALERMWDSRPNLEAMGKTAALTIRSKVPPDPVGDFANKLRAIISPSAAQPR